MSNIIRPVIKSLSVLQYVAIGIGILVGIIMVITSFNSGNSTQATNLIVIIPFLGLFFLTIWGFVWVTKLILEKFEDTLEYKSPLVQITAIILAVIVGGLIAIVVGACLGLLLLFKAYKITQAMQDSSKG